LLCLAQGLAMRSLVTPDLTTILPLSSPPWTLNSIILCTRRSYTSAGSGKRCRPACAASQVEHSHRSSRRTPKKRGIKISGKRPWNDDRDRCPNRVPYFPLIHALFFPPRPSSHKGIKEDPSRNRINVHNPTHSLSWMKSRVEWSVSRLPLSHTQIDALRLM